MDAEASLPDKYFPLSGSEWIPPNSSKKRLPFTHLNLLEGIYKYVPILEWLPTYPWRVNTGQDIAGAITLGCILVAQSLAHADLCKVALICGPYGCILPPLLYSLFGTCIHSSVGTGGLVSLLTGEQLMKFSDDEDERTRAGAIFTLLVGLVISLMGAFRLSFLVRFLSRPALSGFITASAILIMLSQIKPMIGLPKSDVGGILQIVAGHPHELKEFKGATVALSLICMAFLFNAKKLVKLHRGLKFLGDFKELSLLIVTAAVCNFMEADIDKVGDVPSGLPRMAWPLQKRDDLAMAQELLPGAVLVGLVTFLSSFAGAKKFAMMAGYQIVAMNELIALGAANVGGALCGSVPTQIGLSRMGIAYGCGVKSQLGANIYVAGIVAGVLLVFSSYLKYVPRCVLNAIIVTGAWHLLEFEHMCWLWSLRSTRTRQRTYLVDFAVWWVACISTLYLGALQGIVGAVSVSLVLILYQVADPPISVLGWVEAQQRWMHAKAFADARTRDGILAFQLEGPLFYANIERLQEWLAEMEVFITSTGNPLRGIVLSAAAIPFVDTTALDALRQTIVAYHQRNIFFLVSNATGQPKRIFEHEIAHLLPEECLANSWETERCVRFLVEEEHERQKLLETAESNNTPRIPSKGIHAFPTAPGPLTDRLSFPTPMMPTSRSECNFEDYREDESREIRPLRRQADWITEASERTFSVTADDLGAALMSPRSNARQPRVRFPL
mmetsp:Transcript_2562/g.6515  ORF Transcript_2562/g.6515 Transcript_2562/m.6515 type:complete len:727 (-) Transcript_2562:71-2251(-)